MLVTTAATLQDGRIEDYLGVVTGETELAEMTEAARRLGENAVAP